jgi:hypothetical protein
MNTMRLIRAINNPAVLDPTPGYNPELESVRDRHLFKELFKQRSLVPSILNASCEP